MTTLPASPPRVSLVTGGNKGIGLAIVRGLAKQGYVVLIGTRSLERGQEAAANLEGNVIPVQLDVTNQAHIEALITSIGSEYGRLDVLINNAGINTLDVHPLDHLPKPTEETADDMRAVYEVNVFAVVNLINNFLPLLMNSYAPRIVNVTSKRGSIGEEGAWVGQPSMVYSSSKTALNALTVHFAREFKDTKLKVNGAAPGHVATDFNNFRGTRTPDEGAAVAIRLATLDAHGPTGEVYEDETRLAW